MEDLKNAYKHLLNEVLPATYTQPVHFNHCFARIVLDWLYRDCWYYHLNKKHPAISQLSEEQLRAAIGRMQEWLQNQQLLIEDNKASLHYRRKLI